MYLLRVPSLIALALTCHYANAACTIDLNGNVQDTLPLLLRPDGGDSNDAYYLPIDNVGTVIINDDDVIDLGCPGGTVQVNGQSTNSEVAQATCVSGSSFNVNGQTASISGITCSKYPYHIARYTGLSCLANGREIEIGYEMPNKFIKHINVCFDDVLQNSLYSLFNLSAAIGGYQSGFPRPGFIQDDFYNVGGSVDDLYDRTTQRANINALLGLSSGSTQYIKDNDYFLSRGHMTAKADFVYGSTHRTTFHFVNIAPQWQTFNGANWNTLEMNTRSFASDRKLDLLVYTGTHGIATLPHATTGEEVELFLYNGDGVKGLPVPQLYWKVVYDPETKLGVAFLGVNNPYLTDVQSQILCTDVCNQINWVSWNAENLAQGYSYCCTVDDFRKSVSNLPEFEVSGLLV